MRSTIIRWANLLRDTAEPAIRTALERSPTVEWLIREFRDESGNRREIDPLLIRAALRPSQSTPTDTGGSEHPREPAEFALWRSLAFGTARLAPTLLAESSGRGPLLAHPDRTAIEVLTESDLCAMHALWSIARTLRRPDLASRCLASAEWHAAELQPDNATQSPWAIHVFVALAAATGKPSPLLEAELRLHNCMVGRARPDLRSAFILHHAAGELDLLLPGEGEGRLWFQTV